MAVKTVNEIRSEILAKKKTARQIVDEVIEDIAKRDEEYGTFLEVFAERARVNADRIDELTQEEKEKLPLCGVPVAIKDNMLYTGEIASAGSRMLEKYRAPYASTAVARLEREGAIIIGRTNMDEFAFGSSTENSAFKKTKNPWNTSKIPGGTSGGSAAAVAAGFVPLALGTDTGGSVRQPAAMCGVVGIRPTYGRVSRFGIVADASSFDQVGVLANTVEDVTLGLSVIEGKDVHDSTSEDFPVPVKPSIANHKPSPLRIGVPKEYFVDGMDEEVRKRVDEAIEVLKKDGAEIVELSIPATKYALPVYYILQPAEAASNLNRYDGMRYGKRAEGGLEESYILARTEGFGLESKRRIMMGSFILSAGYIDAFYKKALAVRKILCDQYDDAVKQVDVLVCATSPFVAWNLGEKFNDPIAMYLADVLTVTASIVGAPGVSVPCGLAHGLPVGLQFMGRRGDDLRVLQVAERYTSLAPFTEKPNESSR
jgi:aspartyl-tRNA(Asn)/glutamyl-tRNA(Gln) amidotransferase subunit A